MKRYSILILLIVCEITHSQTQDFFPAHLGDMWIFTHVSDVDITTTDTITITRLEEKDNGINIYYNNSSTPRYYKSDNGNVFQYFGDSLSIWWDFTVLSGDTFYTNYYNNTVIINVSYSSQSIFNNTIDCRQFNSLFLNSSINGSQTLGNGIGLIYTESTFMYSTRSFLKGCLINGIGYGTLTDVENHLNDNCFCLSQNYPNPFNSATVIKYSLKEEGLTKLVVYDILGNEIEMLVNDYQTAGVYSVFFNAKNLSSGIYISKIINGSYQQIMKMIYIK